MSYIIKGTLHKKFETEHPTDFFQKRVFVLEYIDSEKTDYIKLQLFQNRCTLLDSFEVGQRVEVKFGIIGKVWQDRYFTSLNAIAIELISKPEASEASQ